MKFKYTLSIILSLTLALSLSSCAPKQNSGESDVGSERGAFYAEEVADMGTEYIDSFIFIGESTTYHLKSRGVLNGGKDTLQVWSPKSGTINLDTTISSLRIVYPETGKEMTVAEAASIKKPQRVLLTFGLNGAVQKISRGEKYFRDCYNSLIDAVLQGSPDTRVILQACFPIAADMDMSNYSVDATTLNSYITTINSWSAKLAQERGLGFLNTSEALIDENGFLKQAYHVGDGHHLTTEAYEVILKYIRTHKA